MFVRQSTYDAMVRDRNRFQSEADAHKSEYFRLLMKWNQLVDRVNRAGGEKLLDQPALNSEQFSQDDIRRLLQLCHPDKHDGKESAVEMTKKLNRLKK